MIENEAICFEIHKSSKAKVLKDANSSDWHLELPRGSQGEYRLAQLDDKGTHPRDQLPWKPPLTLTVCARVSAAEIPGTWGFGFWNDPFSFSLGLGGGKRRFPALPNAAWFFYSSHQNYLSFRNDLPANGLIAQTFQAKRLPALLLALGAPGFALLFWPWLARKMRVLFHRLIAEDSFRINLDATQWQRYILEWGSDRVVFRAGDQSFTTEVTPSEPLGFVLWIDNQYAAFPPNGKFSYGTLPNNQASWLDIKALKITKRVD